MSTSAPETDPHNAWCTKTPGFEGWPRSARAGDPNKCFMVSADGHLHEPATKFDVPEDAQ